MEVGFVRPPFVHCSLINIDYLDDNFLMQLDNESLVILVYLICVSGEHFYSEEEPMDFNEQGA